MSWCAPVKLSEGVLVGSVCVAVSATLRYEPRDPGLPARSADFPRQMDNITVRQGESALLKCQIDGRVTRVAWLNRSSILYAGGDRWTLDRRVSLASHTPSEYSVRIAGVTAHDEGPYTCSIQTQNHPKTSQVHVIVQVPPKIVNISSDVVVSEGSNVTLVCVATGRPDPVLSWRHLSQSALEFEEGEFLDIESIRRDQAGEYECSAANEVSAPDVRRVRVSVKYAPTITEARSVGVPVGRSVMLRCEAQADPSASFTWFKEDRRLLNGLAGLHIQSSGRHSLLTFVNVTEETYGNYTCVAANVLGASNASMLLYMRDDNNGGSAKAVASPWLLLHATFLLLILAQTISCN
ncbi:opioid-binding protein/cell adhesion molecule homolog isoform X2 [Petromyzon marinus]|uniref:Opioid-binding protein/cell adhesion molecule homolog isoform X2 n=1 Tax=Petromyzon marinus TaxID=7757 RepID=A0AAJ7TP46_PETMA|nr:opioid-binding protein/cell adhesion molecule homolog isoform X2 [Petromyzon marinus]